MPADPAAIRLLVLDVDGVLSDGRIILGPDGFEAKAFHARDGMGVKLWRESGGLVAIVTARTSQAVTKRAEELRIEHVVQGSGDKATDVRALCAALGVELVEAAFIGDDWQDLPAMAIVGYPIAVADAEPEVRSSAAWVTTRPGGAGGVRDAVRHLLSARGALAGALARYHREDG